MVKKKERYCLCYKGCPWEASNLRQVFAFLRVELDRVLQFGGWCLRELIESLRFLRTTLTTKMAS